MKKLKAIAAQLTTASRAAATQRAYSDDWKRFENWCRRARRKTMPATEETVTLYAVAALDHYSVSSVERQIAAIAHTHREAGKRSPASKDAEVRAVIAGARRQRGGEQRQKAALRPEHLRQICTALMRKKKFVKTAARDRALLTLGFAMGARRSELVGLDIDDVQFVRKGLLITIRRSKTDQEAHGRKVGVFRGSRKSTCPVRALRAWLRKRGKQSGPLFPGPGKTGRIDGNTINLVVQRAAEMIGLKWRDYGAHSLRAGFVTTAAENGVPETVIMQRTGHRSVETVAKYVRPASAFFVDALAKAL